MILNLRWCKTAFFSNLGSDLGSGVCGLSSSLSLLRGELDGNRCWRWILNLITKPDHTTRSRRKKEFLGSDTHGHVLFFFFSFFEASFFSFFVFPLFLFSRLLSQKRTLRVSLLFKRVLFPEEFFSPKVDESLPKKKNKKCVQTNSSINNFLFKIFFSVQKVVFSLFFARQSPSFFHQKKVVKSRINVIIQTI